MKPLFEHGASKKAKGYLVSVATKLVLTTFKYWQINSFFETFSKYRKLARQLQQSFMRGNISKLLNLSKNHFGHLTCSKGTFGQNIKNMSRREIFITDFHANFAYFFRC